MTTHRILTLSTAAVLIAGPALAQSEVTFTRGERNTEFQPASEDQFRAPLEKSAYEFETETLAGGLNHPWGMAVLPGDAGYLVTERAGRLRHVGADGTLSDPITGLPEIVAQEQGGLLDVALGPDFGQDRMIYWTYSKSVGDGLTATAAARGTLSEDLTEVTEAEDIFVQEPGSTAPMHYGSRIVFPGDGTAYITTGEHFTQKYRQYAQDLDKTYGKVIRVNLDGTTPDDNPFVGDAAAIDSIWSSGHRNLQGAALRPDGGQLWTIEHGPQGGDELNMPQPGANYGWPVISYGEQYSGNPIGSGESAQDGMEQPVYFWDPVIAPAGMDFYEGEMFPEWQGDLLISSLSPGGVVRLALDGDRVSGEERLLRDIGRVRDIEVIEDGSFLILTDREDGELLHITKKQQSG